MRVLFYGNCQMGRLAECFGQIVNFHADCDVAFSYVDSATVEAEAAVSQFGPDKTIFQVTRQQPLAPAGLNALRVPALFHRPLWPFYDHDERIIPGVITPISAGDALATRLMKECADPREAFDRYKAFEFHGDYDLDRLWERHQYRYRHLDSLSDVQVGEWMDAEIRQRQLFNMFWHPSPETYSYVAGPVCDYLGLAPHHSEIAQAIVRVTESQLPEIPVHPTVAAYYGIEWAPPHRTYEDKLGHLDFDGWLMRHLT